jgi:hypothetical protein
MGEVRLVVLLEGEREVLGRALALLGLRRNQRQQRQLSQSDQQAEIHMQRVDEAKDSVQG